LEKSCSPDGFSKNPQETSPADVSLGEAWIPVWWNMLRTGEYAQDRGVQKTLQEKIKLSVQMGGHSSRFTQYDYFRLFLSFFSLVKSYRNLSCVAFFVLISFPVFPPQLQALSKLSNDDNARMASAPVASSGLC